MENSEENKLDYITKSDLRKTISFFVVFTLIFASVIGGAIGLVSAIFIANRSSYSTNLSSTGKVENLPVVQEQSAITSVVSKTNDAVVSIIISQEVPNINNYFDIGSGLNINNGGSTLQEVGAGSGFIISSDGYILTNKHVVSNASAQYTVIMNNGKQYNAKIVGTDPTNDIAVVKINASGLPTIPLGNSSGLQLGQSVVAIGNALGQYQNTVDTGVISGLNRNVQAQDPATGATENLTGMIQTDANINPGNSGGPLLNLLGQAIGINTAVDSSANAIGFAIPINQAKSDVNSILSTGKIVKPELGVDYELVTSGIQQQYKIPYNYGAYVVNVISNTPASSAGIKSGDVILSVNGTQISESNSLSYLIGEESLNSTVTLRVYSSSGGTSNIKVDLNKSFS